MKIIPLTQGKETIVDDDDFEELNKYKWYASHRGNTFYAQRRFGKGTIFMHREVFPVGSNDLIDHIDGNGLNNQKCNLRRSSKRENAQNMHIKKTSKYPGVHFDKGSGKWIASIRINGARKNLGRFSNEQLAFERYITEVKAL